MQNEWVMGSHAKIPEGQESQAIRGIVGILEKGISEGISSNKAQRVRCSGGSRMLEITEL